MASEQNTSFIGRRKELATIEHYFENPERRLLTLVGAGGIGKTRIAQEAATRLSDRFADGSRYVALEAISSPAMIVPAIASTIEYTFRGMESPLNQLLNFLRKRDILLVLDNFEHVIEGVDIITAIVGQPSDVRLLVTSRERLNLREEWAIDVTGLDYPMDAMAARGEDHSALQLFLERAIQVKSDFRMTSDNLSDVIRICRLVEGMPLGIELAASWIRMLSCQAIGDEIERNLDFLTSQLRDVLPRHQSMRAVFAHSFRLLTEAEKRVFSQLSVFRGGFLRDAAKAVADASLELLASLVDKSLLRVDFDDRYYIHELLRQYGDEQLAALGLSNRVYESHANFYADFMRRRVDDLKGRRQLQAIKEVNADFNNVRTAWMWAAQHNREALIDAMIDGLWVYCELRNREQEGHELFQYAEQQFAPEQDATMLWQRLLARAAAGETIQIQLRNALRLAQGFDNPAEIAFCMARLGKAAHRQKDQMASRQWFLQSLSILRQLDDHFAISSALFWLLTTMTCSWEEVKQFGDEAVRRSRQIGDRFGAVRSLSFAAVDAARLGRFEEAESMWLERIAFGKEINHVEGIGGSYVMLAETVYLVQGRLEETQILGEECMRLTLKYFGEAYTGRLLVILGLIAIIREDYVEGIRLCQQGSSSHWDSATGYMAAWGMAIASCGSGDYETAQESLSTAYDYVAKHHAPVGILCYLPVAAAILAHHGDAVGAVEFLGLAFTHPIDAGWMKRWKFLDRLRDKLETELGTEAYTAAWEQGKNMNLDDVAVELEKQYGNSEMSTAQQANQNLADPLTPRELDVLKLLEEDLSNAQIAERLFVTVGTVKSYTNKLYQKLAVSNRDEAVIQAQKLKLL